MGLSTVNSGTPAPMPPPSDPVRGVPQKELPADTSKGPPKAPA